MKVDVCGHEPAVRLIYEKAFTAMRGARRAGDDSHLGMAERGKIMACRSCADAQRTRLLAEGFSVSVTELGGETPRGPSVLPDKNAGPAPAGLT